MLLTWHNLHYYQGVDAGLARRHRGRAAGGFRRRIPCEARRRGYRAFVMTRRVGCFLNRFRRGLRIFPAAAAGGKTTSARSPGSFRSKPGRQARAGHSEWKLRRPCRRHRRAKGVPLAQPFILVRRGAPDPEKEQESRLAGLYDLNISPDVGLNARSFLPFCSYAHLPAARNCSIRGFIRSTSSKSARPAAHHRVTPTLRKLIAHRQRNIAERFAAEHQR